MRNKEIVKTTDNRNTFNKAYKLQNEKEGEIVCSRCSYHGGENVRGQFYGGWGTKIKHPNWKLTSKHKKQWMPKQVKITTETQGWLRKWKGQDLTWIKF